MDKTWMKKDRLSNEYEEGVDSFIEFAQLHLSGKTFIHDVHVLSVEIARC